MGVDRQSYGRRSRGLQSSASLLTLLTNFLNLLALGRCQPSYVVFRLCEDLCF
jgi:hypothetical protein